MEPTGRHQVLEQDSLTYVRASGPEDVEGVATGNREV